MPELLLASRRCNQCLTTANRIVSGERAAQIVRQCRAERIHFFCHKGAHGTEAQRLTHCRGVHDALDGSTAHDLAVRLGIRITEIDPDSI